MKRVQKSITVFMIFASLFLSAHSATISGVTVPPQPFKTGDAVVANDAPYYKHKIEDKNIELIYTRENIPFAKHTLAIEEKLNEEYEKLFGWEFDERLYVGLISENNQIANGFSTQWPNNRQINYIGGTSGIDYFANTSWLDLLLYHETAHNYQLNVKGSSVSRWLHSVFGNGSVYLPLPFTVPNSVENSFMLEGNAVLNESWHASGGRLYSGRFKAMTLLQAKAGNIKANEMYNAKLAFPYLGDIYYQIGGFYNLYLAEKYGLNTLNKYFVNKSKDWWFPFYTNATMEETIGEDFEKSIDDFATVYEKISQKLVLAQGEHLASSQFYMPLSSNKDEIFFLTNESGVRMNELIVLNKNEMSIIKKRDGWLSGKVIKKDAEYFTQASNHTSPTKISQGLFNANANIKEGSDSQMIQGYLSDGKPVYFDVKSSYDSAQLYVAGEYYGIANSSVIIDKDDNIYYFTNKNKSKERTLYKNDTPLFTYQGFYGIVCDVDSQGAVYFIANSALGSTLYRYADEKVTRVSKADNIIEARLINDDEVLLSAISDKDYYYVKNDLVSINEKPLETKLFFEDKSYYKNYTSQENNISNAINTSELYIPLLNLHYSGTDFAFGVSETDDYIGFLNLNFGDPLSQNAANIFLSRDDSNITIAGVGYENSEHLLHYSLSAYGVVDDYNRNNTRSSGLIAGVSLPIYKVGYSTATFEASYFQDYDTREREPLTLSANFENSQRHGISMFDNISNEAEVYGVQEGEDNIFGGEYAFSHDLAYETYISMSAKYSASNANINSYTAQVNSRGVKVSSLNFQADMDKSTIEMPTIAGSYYVKSAAYGEIGLSKVLNFSSYWFTFPFSLQREAIYSKYRYYDIESFNSFHRKVNEEMLGLRMDVVFFNIGALPLSIEYYHNDNPFFTDNANQFRFLLGTAF